MEMFSPDYEDWKGMTEPTKEQIEAATKQVTFLSADYKAWKDRFILETLKQNRAGE